MTRRESVPLKGGGGGGNVMWYRVDLANMLYKHCMTEEQAFPATSMIHQGSTTVSWQQKPFVILCYQSVLQSWT